jgi:hypothetical protein
MRNCLAGAGAIGENNSTASRGIDGVEIVLGHLAPLRAGSLKCSQVPAPPALWTELRRSARARRSSTR